MRTAFFLASASLLGFFVACSSSAGSSPAGSDGGGSSAGDSISGTVGGKSPQVISATARYWDGTLGGTPSVSLVLWSSANTCSLYTDRTFTEFSFDVPGRPLRVGTFAIISGDYVKGPLPTNGQATVAFDSTTDCHGVGTSEYATSGTLTITATDASHLAGTFDLTFPDGHVAGTFDSPICNVDASAIKSACP